LFQVMPGSLHCLTKSRSRSVSESGKNKNII
jgi:hypothetical protein